MGTENLADWKGTVEVRQFPDEATAWSAYREISTKVDYKNYPTGSFSFRFPHTNNYGVALFGSEDCVDRTLEKTVGFQLGEPRLLPPRLFQPIIELSRSMGLNL